MRTIISNVVFFILSFCFYNFSEASEDSNIFFDRGFAQNKCYRENVKYECNSDCSKCILHVYHDIKAQLSFEAANLKSFCHHNKSDTGWAGFKFRYANEKAVADVFDFIPLKKENSEILTDTSKIKPKLVSCPK